MRSRNVLLSRANCELCRAESVTRKRTGSRSPHLSNDHGRFEASHSLVGYKHAINEVAVILHISFYEATREIERANATGNYASLPDQLSVPPSVA